MLNHISRSICALTEVLRQLVGLQRQLLEQQQAEFEQRRIEFEHKHGAITKKDQAILDDLHAKADARTLRLEALGKATIL